MTGLEQAIRNALDRAERANPAIRTRIYQSARNALDTGLRKQDVQDADVIARQRQRLEATIEAIETEELERLRMAARLEKMFIESTPFATAGEDDIVAAPEARRAVGDSVDMDPAPDMIPERPRSRLPDDFEDGSLSALSVTRDDASTGSNVRTETPNRQPGTLKVDAEDFGGRGRRGGRHIEEDPAWAEPSTPEGRTMAPSRRKARRQRSSWFVSLFVYCVLLGIVGAAGWWVYSTGMITAALHGDGNFDFIPKVLQTEDFDPQGQANSRVDPLRRFTPDWVTVFVPGDADQVTTSAQAKIGDVVDSDGKAITIASSAPDQDGEVRIAVPAAIMTELAGKTSTLAITLRVDGDVASQIYVQCAFGAIGDCGRHRFTVSSERVDELIELKLKGTPATAETGYIVINSDLTGEGKAIRLYGIRVRPSE